MTSWRNTSAFLSAHQVSAVLLTMALQTPDDVESQMLITNATYLNNVATIVMDMEDKDKDGIISQEEFVKSREELPPPDTQRDEF